MNSSSQKTQAMRLGGKKLAAVKNALSAMVAPGVTFEAIEAKAQELIKEHGAKPSFSTVAGYHHATCITKNEGCCHGVPVGHTIAEKDLITIDVGLIFDGYHVDTSTTVYAGDPSSMSKKVEHFLKIGPLALEAAIDKARISNTVYDISKAIEHTIESAGYSPVYQLTGHAVGKSLHEDPQVPCVSYKSDKKKRLFAGQTLAIEPMYAMGNAFLVVGKDGWTYETKDKSLTAMFEETILITDKGPEVLTR